MLKPLPTKARRDTSLDEPLSAGFLLASGAVLISILAARLITIFA
jgi:hypothetical protein